MFNWKDSNQYKHLKSGDVPRETWCWEFMRRNEEYQSNYDEAQTSNKRIYEPPKENNETDNHWRTRVELTDAEPLKLSMGVYYARKWKLVGSLQNPKDAEPPAYLSLFPKIPNWEELDKYYHSLSVDSPVTHVPGFATVIFDLGIPIDGQLSTAKKLIEKHKVSEKKKANKYVVSEWPLYLKVFDAKKAGAENNEIISILSEYKNLDNSAENGYQVSKKISVHYKAAKKLISSPLAILGY